MGILTEKLLADDTRPTVVNDCVRVIEDEVASKKGVSGLAIKGAFKALKAIKPGMVRNAVNGLLDEFVENLDPFYQRFVDAGKPGGIESYLVKHDGEVSDALLSITDGKARTTSNKTLKKLYDKLRPQGKKQVQAAMPRVGKMLAKHGL
ncbi:MAG: DUF6918 family protein [Bradymonadia bacterium]